MLFERMSPESLIILIPMLAFALTLHEFAHAAVGYALGDDTGKLQGRLTLNPLAHLDPIGSIMIILVGFGYAKPVPFNPRRFKNPRRDIGIVAAAGPVSNLLLGIVFGLALRFGMRPMYQAALESEQALHLVEAVIDALFWGLQINLCLAILNFLPIFPLDGSKVLQSLLPRNLAVQFEQTARFGIFFFLVILLVDPIREILYAPAGWIASLLIGGGF